MLTLEQSNVVKRRKYEPVLLTTLMLAALGAAPAITFAGGVQTLAPVEVVDSAENLVGSADSSTEGTVTAKQLANRPLLRTGELLETVPGLWISQHSGEGKANQYYLRGFNLDHGTDLATSVAGMPVNMPTHAHGQGYSDLNFVIPELVSGIQYRKGPYYAEEGDFSSAGAVHMDYVKELKRIIASGTVGTDGYYRGLVAASNQLAGGSLLYGLEYFHNDGPWVKPDDYNKFNGVLRYSKSFEQNDLSLTVMGYNGKWNSTDQVAKRALDSGLIPRFGSLDTTDGGNSYRYSLSGDWQHTWESSVTKANFYLISYGMDLYSNFTYFLDDPVNGDQFHQKDRRVITGLNASHTWMTRLFGHDTDNTVGMQIRNDNIAPVALYHTKARQLLSTTRQDHVTQTSYGFYFQDGFKWADKFRTVAGVRGDYYTWSVNSDNPLNSGDSDAFIASPKLSMIFGPWAKTEFFVNLGEGFHSNDGRGSTINVDPKTGDPVSKVSPLVRTKGAEVGVRTAVIPHLQSELSFWFLDMNSELLFTGDAGSTEPSRPSRRYGFEFANYYTPTPWLTFDADIAYSHSRFKDSDPVGDRIPGSPEGIINAGVSIDDIDGFLGSLRVQWFGPRPLIEDNSVRSSSTTIVNARVGYKFKFKPVENWRLLVDVFNVFDTKASDIDYFYTSRLAGEPAGGVNDIHTHPHEPREVRVTLNMNF
jgi:hypothetical protein